MCFASCLCGVRVGSIPHEKFIPACDDNIQILLAIQPFVSIYFLVHKVKNVCNWVRQISVAVLVFTI
jgi:hypothetical protein